MKRGKNKVLKPHFDVNSVYFQTWSEHGFFFFFKNLFIIPSHPPSNHFYLNVVNDVAVLLDVQLGAQTSISSLSNFFNLKKKKSIIGVYIIVTGSKFLNKM